MENWNNKENIIPTSALQVYNPSELLNIFSDILARQNTSSKVIYLRGVYFKQRYNSGWAYAYDLLRDENDQQELTIMIAPSLRDELKDGALVQVGGTLTRKVNAKGFIQLIFQVSRIEIVKEQVISEEDLQKSELRTLKSARGFKNVDAILEDKLYRGERPIVALVFASTSITMADFDAGKESASAHIDFEEHRVSFSKSSELVDMLKYLDNEGDFDAIALVRGGGGGIEALDEIPVLESIVELETPLICAVGHVDEKIFIKNLADKVAPTPNGLGTYFSSMVESVIQKRNRSRAVLVEEVKQQYIKQIDTAEKQNKSLQEHIEKMTKASTEAQANFKAQSESMTKQLATLQENLRSIQKTNEEQAKQFAVNISDMQKTNKALQESLAKATEQSTKAASELTVSKSKAAELETQLKQAKAIRTFTIVISIVTIVVALIVLI